MKKLVVGAFLAFALGSWSFTTRFGLDTFDIYLNNTLALHQAVNQPLSSRVLSLDKAKPGDQLRFVYRHCHLENGSGTNRSITLKDESGAALRKWDFTDAGQMTIAVKDLQQAEKKSAAHQFSLYYTAYELDKSEMLATIRLK